MIPLTRPLTVFDLETTTANPSTARIVQIAIIRLHPDGKRDRFSSLVNPLVPIPAEATAIHGITDTMVAGAPTWRQLAPRLIPAFRGADFCGYNIARFDLEVIRHEFQRVGVDTARTPDEPIPHILDPYLIWVKQEPRTLSDAVQRFLGRSLDGAHDALVDVEAALNVVEAMLDAWPALPQTLPELHAFQFPPVPGQIDGGARFVFNAEGVPCINFGKYKGVPLTTLVRTDRGYLRWVAGNTAFTDETRQIARDACDGRFPEQEAA